jgi:hypothetical protein
LVLRQQKGWQKVEVHDLNPSSTGNSMKTPTASGVLEERAKNDLYRTLTSGNYELKGFQGTLGGKLGLNKNFKAVAPINTSVDLIEHRRTLTMCTF